MPEKISQETRSRMMSGIRGRDTKPELQVRRYLHAAGYRFRLFRKDLPGRPDIVLPGRKVVIFVHGCFWHGHVGCPLFRVPKTRTEFWVNKIEQNARRDQAAIHQLLADRWRVAVVWECALRSDEQRALNAVVEFIRGDDASAEISAPLTAISGRHE